MSDISLSPLNADSSWAPFNWAFNLQMMSLTWIETREKRLALFRRLKRAAHVLFLTVWETNLDRLFLVSIQFHFGVTLWGLNFCPWGPKRYCVLLGCGVAAGWYNGDARFVANTNVITFAEYFLVKINTLPECFVWMQWVDVSFIFGKSIQYISFILIRPIPYNLFINTKGYKSMSHAGLEVI